jgi:hypothetical protein
MPMLSRGEAQNLVAVTLKARQLTVPMTQSELAEFCGYMVGILEFSPRRGRMADVRRWVLAWETSRFSAAR